MDTSALGPVVQNLILSRFPHTPTCGQRDVCAAMARFLYDADPRSAFLLKGYAGTGKTSLVSALIQVLPQLKVNTLLLAPTGRAAKVIASYSGRPAFTIHKKIYMTVTDASGAVRTARAINKHAYTLFIVDEASMIGLEPTSTRQSLLEDLIDYVYDGNHCRLMLIGDTAQLPPVGQTESPALDERYLAAAFGLNVLAAELTEVVRQQQLSGILSNATSLRTQISSLTAAEAQMPLFAPNGTDVVRLSGEDLMETLFREYGDFALDQVVVGLIEIPRIPGVCDTSRASGEPEHLIYLVFRVSACDAGHVGDVVGIHSYEIVILVVVASCHLACAVRQDRYPDLPHLADGPVMRAVADLLPARGSGVDIELIGQSLPVHHILEHELRHCRTADVAVTYE